MGPLTGCEPPCWERPGCLHCWLFTECYCGKQIPTHKNRGEPGPTRTHPVNRQHAVAAAAGLTRSQLIGIFKQERDWTHEDKLWPIPEKEGCDTLYSGVEFVCEDCWNLSYCKNRSAKRYRKRLKKEERRRKKMPPEWYGGSDDVNLKPTNTPLGLGSGVHNKRMKYGGNMFSTPSMRGPGGLPPHNRKEGETVAPGEPTMKKNRKGEPNFEKAKTRFRAAAWWCFGAVIGLIGGKFFVDFVVYMGMPLKTTEGPERIWSVFMWVALVAVYVCLFGAFWMGLSVIRKKFSMRTSYDVTLGDVRVVKVDPELANNLLTYEPNEKPQIEMIAEAVTTDAEEVSEESEESFEDLAGERLVAEGKSDE